MLYGNGYCVNHTYITLQGTTANSQRTTVPLRQCSTLLSATMEAPVSVSITKHLRATVNLDTKVSANDTHCYHIRCNDLRTFTGSVFLIWHRHIRALPLCMRNLYLCGLFKRYHSAFKGSKTVHFKFAYLFSKTKLTSTVISHRHIFV